MALLLLSLLLLPVVVLLLLSQPSINNGLGTRNNVLTVEKKHFDAFFETWEMTSSDRGTANQINKSRGQI